MYFWYLMHGPQLNDPARLLRGTGKETRFLQLESAKDVERPEVKALINAASALATIPIPGTGKGRLIIQSSAATRQARVARQAPAK